MKTYNISIQPSGRLNANFNSSGLQLKFIYGYSIQISISGTPTGTFVLQGSCDPYTDGLIVPASEQPSNWTTISGSSYVASAAGTFLWNMTDVMYNWVRLVFTDGSSGASTAVLSSAIFNGKGT